MLYSVFPQRTSENTPMQVTTYLDKHAVTFEPIAHPPAYHAQQRAKVLHVTGRKVAKGVLLIMARGPLLAIVPATHQVDTASLEREFQSTVRLATNDEVAALFRDCEWGVVSPFGTLYGLPVVLDTSFTADDLLVFTGNTHVEAVRLRCGDYERLERPLRLALAVDD